MSDIDLFSAFIGFVGYPVFIFLGKAIINQLEIEGDKMAKHINGDASDQEE